MGYPTKHNATGSPIDYARCLESFVSVPKAYLPTLRERGSLTRSVVRLTVLKAEVCQFSCLVEQVGAERVSAALNPVYEKMVTIVRERDGEIIEFQPDRLTVVWGIVSGLNSTLDAVVSAIELRDWFNQYRFGDTPRPDCALSLRAGLAQGRVAEMVIGSSLHQAYSVIGPPVVQATHLRQAASAGEIRVSRTVQGWTADRVAYQPCHGDPDLGEGEGSFSALYALP